MTITAHNTNVYVGLAGESALIIGAEGTPLGEGGMYRLAEGEAEWVSIDNGLPENPQVRALLAHPDRPATVFAGTQDGVYRTDDRGETWRRTDTLSGDVWSLAAHPNDSNIMFAGYDAGRVCRSNDGGDTWQQMNTEGLVHPHITMNPYEICKRVIGLSIDPGYPDDVYGAIEVGGLIKSTDGGDTWSCITDGHYTRLGPVDLHGVQVNPTSPGLVYSSRSWRCSAAGSGAAIGNSCPLRRCLRAAATAATWWWILPTPAKCTWRPAPAAAARRPAP